MNKTHANYLLSTFHVFVIKGVIHLGFLSNQLKSPSDLNRPQQTIVEKDSQL